MRVHLRTRLRGVRGVRASACDVPRGACSLLEKARGYYSRWPRGAWSLIFELISATHNHTRHQRRGLLLPFSSGMPLVFEECRWNTPGVKACFELLDTGHLSRDELREVSDFARMAHPLLLVCMLKIV